MKTPDERIEEIQILCALAGVPAEVEIDLEFSNANGSQCVVNKILVPPSRRHFGLAKKALRVICEYLDQERLTATLSVMPLENSIDETGLMRLYEEFGFTSVSTGSTRMIRGVA